MPNQGNIKAMEISEKIKALVNLLGEQEQETYRQIREELVNMGSGIIPDLDNWALQTPEPLVRSRIEKIIQQIQFRQICNEVTTWCLLDSQDLMIPWLSISHMGDSLLNDSIYTSTMDEIVRAVWLEINEQHTCMEQINILNKVIFELWGFGFAGKYATDAESSYIDTFFQSKLGNAWSLGMLYLIVAERLNLPIQAVLFPHNFVLGYRDVQKENAMLCYLNPSNGIVFSKEEIDEYLLKIHVKPRDMFYKPCSKTQIILQLVENLLYAYDIKKDVKHIAQLETLKNILIEKGSQQNL